MQLMFILHTKFINHDWHKQIHTKFNIFQQFESFTTLAFIGRPKGYSAQLHVYSKLMRTNRQL